MVHRPTPPTALASLRQPLGVGVLGCSVWIHQRPAQGRAVEPPALHHLACLAAQSHLNGFDQAPGRKHVEDVSHQLLIEIVLPLEGAVEIFHRAPAFPGLEPAAELTTQRQRLDAPVFQLPRNGAGDHAACQLRFLVTADTPHLLQISSSSLTPLELFLHQGIAVDR